MRLARVTDNFKEFKYCECGCGKTIPLVSISGHKQKFYHGHNRKGLYSNYNGGRKKCNGYILILKKDHYFCNGRGYVPEHRLVYEEYNNCCLLPYVAIHHINHIRDDNRIENLQPMYNDEHMRLHMTKDKSNRICLLCKSKTTWQSKDGREFWFKHNKGFICRKCYRKKIVLN